MVEMTRDKGENEFKDLTDEGRHGAESSFLPGMGAVVAVVVQHWPPRHIAGLNWM
jgi:hypothetical protein